MVDHIVQFLHTDPFVFLEIGIGKRDSELVPVQVAVRVDVGYFEKREVFVFFGG